MSEHQTLSGRCLCGAVEIHAERKNNHFGACHCAMCRTWGGGPLLAVECDDRVTFKGEYNIQTYKSSDWAERGFCKRCGTHLFYRLSDNPFYAIPIGVFGDIDDWQFDHQVFIDHKPAYYSFVEKTKTMTEAEVFAQFS